jgi:hypothetical protein
MSSDDRNRGLFGKTLSRLINAIPGVEQLRETADDSSKEKKQQSAEKFLETLSAYLDQDNFAAVSLYLSQRQEDPGLQVLVDDSLKDVMSVDHELGKRCTVLAMVDRIHNFQLPDGIYRQVVRVLQEADGPTLRVLLEMADAVHALNHHFIALMAGEIEEGPIAYMISPRKDPVFLSAGISPSAFRQVIDLLVNHRAANRWVGMGSSHNKAPGIQDLTLQHLGRIDDYHLPLWAALRNYLEPVR